MKNRFANKGFTFVEVILTMGIITILAVANLQLILTMNSSTADANNRVRAISAAWVEWNEIASQDYSTVSSVAKTTIPAYSPVQKEITVTTSTCDSNPCKLVTIKIYPYSTSVDPIFQITQKRLSTSTSTTASVPRGVIAVWYGSAATIPSGWAICDGNNGTPDLRSRFIYGAGGDTNTKATIVSGWNTPANGHWAIGFAGGEEVHYLTLAQMPSHTHSGSTTVAGGSHTHNLPVGYSSGFGPVGLTQGFEWSSYTAASDAGNSSHSHGVNVTYAGGTEGFNFFPRFITMAFIMKL